MIEYLNNKLGANIYTLENLSISGTHTHSGPAGFLQYIVYQVTSFGYVQETMDAWVIGISESIIMAHNSLKSTNVLINSGDLYESNINRSPTSYLLNPEAERSLYPEGDTDKRMLLLKFVNDDNIGATRGVYTWFSVHGTAINNTNTLVNGDNRGYASYKLEQDVNGVNVLPGVGPFVAAFASTNLGDVSPNTNGAKCIDTGLPCDGLHSSCNGRSQKCIAFGPGQDMYESAEIIGQKQVDFAKNLMITAKESVSGVIDSRHSFVDFTKINVTLADGSTVKLCTPAMGYSFASGTTDGPGMFNFTQGTTSGNEFWDKVRDFLETPTAAEIACQAPKPILVNTGSMDRPYAWDPKTLALQIMRVGNLFVLSVPSEFTTMSGRRLRNAVYNLIK